MKKIYYVGVFCLFLLGQQLAAQLPTIEIGDGVEEQGLPVFSYHQYSYSQTIFLQEELDVEGQRIQKIAFYYQGGRQTEEQIRVYMRHTDQDVLTGYITEGLQLVYQGPYPLMNQEGWAEIALTTPFEYNNVDNLLIAVTEDKPGFILNCAFNSTATDDTKSVLAKKDISPAYDPFITPAGFTLKNFRPNIRFWFEEIPQGAAMSIQPSQLYYLYIRENEEKSHNVTVHNTGTEDLVITGFNNNQLPFASNFTGTIAPGESQMVDIRFVPVQPGEFKGFVTLESNATPVHVYVEGYAVNGLAIIETFDNTEFPPEQWSVDPNTWTRRGFGGYEGANAYLNTGTDEGYLITPKLNVQQGDELVFYSAMQLDGVLTVSHSYDMVTWTELETITLSRSFLRYIIDLDDYQGLGYIGFSGVPRIYLDYVIAPAIYSETPPNPSANPMPAEGIENAFITQMLGWNASALATGYKVYVGTDNPPTNLVNGEDVGTMRSFKTPVLENETEYFWQVVPYNQQGDAVDCPVWSFNTIAYNPVSTFPFKEGFEDDNGAVPPAGWINQDGHWLTTTTSVNTGSYAARVMFNHDTDAELITPPIEIPELDSLEMIFYWKNGNVFGAENDDSRVIGHDTLWVEVTSDNGQNWVAKGIFSAEQSMETYLPVNVDLNEYSGSEVYVRFRHSTNNSTNYSKAVGIDDISIQGALTEPELWINSESWAAGSIANNTFVVSEEFAIRNMGASELVITSATLEGDYFTTTLVAEDVSLAFGEEYTFTMGFEPFEAGEFAATLTLETNAGTAVIALDGVSEAVELFTSEGFEDGLVPPHGWMNHTLGEEGSGWMRAWDHAQPAHSGTFSAISFSYVPGWGDMAPDNYLVTSKMLVGENQELAFWIAAADSTYCAEHYSVYVSTTTNRIDQFTHMLHEETLKPVHAEWSQRIFDMSEWEGQEIYVAFRHHATVGQYLIKLDDIELRDELVMHTPYADPAEGEVEQGTEVSLFTDTPEAAIYYTTDGEDPDTESILYEGPVAITGDVTINAVAFKNFTYSEIATFEYTIADSNVSVDFVSENQLKVYPNPATSTLWIEKATDGNFNVALYDVFGAVALSTTMSSNIISLDIDGLAKGVYFLRLTDGKNSYQQKVVIQ